jgi:hypothetical protein
MRGATLRTAAKAIFGLSDFQANNVSAVQIKEFMESRAREILVSLQKDVNNYYAGRAADNLRAGGILGSNKNMLKQLHSNLPNRQLTDSEYRNYRNLAGQYQIAAFRAGYDESPFFDNTAKLALARGEYVARWYQIYYGGEPDSTIYAKFLIEDGTAAIDNLIQNGS